MSFIVSDTVCFFICSSFNNAVSNIRLYIVEGHVRMV
jgi:hypothetical protein